MFRNPVMDAVIVLVIVLLFVGPKKLPALGKGLGHGMREFKDGITGQSKPEHEEAPAINKATPMPGTGAQAGAAAAAAQHPATEPQATAGSAPAESQHRA
jgi:sec-independent protein translocase protein TatA